MTCSSSSLLVSFVYLFHTFIRFTLPGSVGDKKKQDNEQPENEEDAEESEDDGEDDSVDDED